MKYRDEPVTWAAIQKFARTRDNFRSSDSSSDSELETPRNVPKEIVVNISETRKPDSVNTEKQSERSEVKIEYDHKQKRFYVVHPSGTVDGDDASVLFANQDSGYRGSYRGRGGRGGPSYNHHESQRRSHYEDQVYNNSGAKPKRGNHRPHGEYVMRSFNCNRTGHRAKECHSRTLDIGKSSAKICYVCGKPGHVSTYCRYRKGPRDGDEDRGNRNQDRKESSNF